MVRLLILLALLAAGAFGYPLATEQAGTACAALETRLLGLAPAGAAAGATAWLGSLGVANGAVAEDMARRHYPTLPPAVGCTVAYWLTLVPPVTGKGERRD
jgi:hypothetical protein